MEHIAQALMGDRRPIAPYQDDQHVPYPLRQAFTFEELAPFVDKHVLVTFTVKVPLEEVARATDGTLVEFIEATWMAGQAVMMSPEYRAVGATYDDFGQRYSGFVHLQVTCQLAAPYKG